MADRKVSPKRERILRAAAEVFSIKGYYNAKIEDIANEAGVGKGTVYEYFPSKERLLRSTLIEGTEAIAGAIRGQIARETTTRGKLIAFASKNIEIGRKYRVLSKITMMVTSIMDESFRQWLIEMHRGWLVTLEEIIEEGIETGQIRPLDIACFARVFSGGIGIVSSPLADRPEENPQSEEAMAAEIVDYFLRGISAK